MIAWQMLGTPIGPRVTTIWVGGSGARLKLPGPTRKYRFSILSQENVGGFNFCLEPLSTPVRCAVSFLVVLDLSISSLPEQWEAILIL